MKFLRNLTTYTVTMAFALIVMAGAFVSTAAAGSPVFNNHPNDGKTLTVANVTDNPNCTTCWSGSTSAEVGEKVEVYLYFHNNGTAPALNTRLRIQDGPVSNDGNFTGRITAANWSGQENDTAFVNIPNTSYLEFIPGSARFYPNVQQGNVQSLSFAQEQAIFSSNGFNAGTVMNGAFNGALIVAYRVMDDTPSNDEVTINTLNETGVDDNSATLRGEVTEATDLVDTWFYWSDTFSDIDLNCNPNNCPNGNFLSVSGVYGEDDVFSKTLTGLEESTTYYYKACGELVNNGDEDCGSIQTLTTLSDNNGGGNDDQTIINTLSATNIDEDSATLRGEVDLTESEAEVWFYWSDDEDDVQFNCDADDCDDANTLTVSGDYSTNQDFDRTLTGLDDNTTYYYRACGRDNDTNDDDCGSVYQFETDDDDNGGNNNNDDDLEISTNAATNIGQYTATLRGEVDQAAGDEVDVWFEWSDDEDEVLDGDGVFRDVSGEFEEGDSFSRSISGLAPDTRYYFRACGYDPDTDGDDEDCGSIRTFETDNDGEIDEPEDDGPGVVVGILPTVVTITANDITATGATFAGGFNSNTSCDVTTGYFQYGRTTALGNNSTTIAINDTKGVFFQRVEGLTPGATYFYRAAAVNCNGLGIGALRSFRTASAYSVPSTPTPSTPTVVVSSGEGDGVINLLIDDHLDTVVNGQISTYEVNWENLTDSELDRIEIEVQLPNEGKFLSTTRGQYNEDNHTVFIEIDDLDAGDDGEAFITMEIRDTRGTETLVVASAVAVFENPDTGARSNAIDFDDTQLVFASNNLGASIFGNGFWPVTLLGWLFLLLILFVIFVAVRYLALRQAPRPVYYSVPQNSYAPYQPTPRS